MAEHPNSRSILVHGGRVTTFAPSKPGEPERVEAYLRDLLHDRPELVPMEDVAPGQEAFVPLAKEFAVFVGDGRRGFIDILGVTPFGRICVVECKLWRNPEARRKVLAQVLDYASALRRVSHSDIVARLRRKHDARGKDPIHDAVAAAGYDVDPARFVDAVSESLERGDIQLIIAGDGIRRGLDAVMRQLDERVGILANVSLLEVATWKGDDGTELVMPRVAMRTEVLERRVMVDQSGSPLADVSEPDEVVLAEGQLRGVVSETRAENRRFFDRVLSELAEPISQVHPEQEAARHGGNNWIKIPFPEPATHITAYRTKAGQVGVFFRLLGDEADGLVEEIESSRARLEEELGATFAAKRDRNGHWVVASSEMLAGSSGSPESEQLAWFTSMVPCFIAGFREVVVSTTR